MTFPVPDEVAGQARAAGPLESPWLWLTLAALALACVAGTILLRRRKVARGCGIALTLLLVLLATTAFVNARVGYVRSGTDLVLVLQRGDLGKLFEDEGAAPGTQRIRLAGPDGPLVERMVLADPANAVPPGRTFGYPGSWIIPAAPSRSTAAS